MYLKTSSAEKNGTVIFRINLLQKAFYRQHVRGCGLELPLLWEECLLLTLQGPTIQIQNSIPSTLRRTGGAPSCLYLGLLGQVCVLGLGRGIS